MRYLKMLGLLAVAAAALMAFAGTASATVTFGGSAYNGHEHYASKHVTIGFYTCKQGTTTKTTSGGATSGTVTLAFSECGGDTVSVVKSGTLTISSNGTVTSNGAEITGQTHRTVFGFPVTTHCIYVTSNTAIGTLTEGTTTITLSGTNLPKVATDGACGETAPWEGTYTITQPGALTVD